MEIEWRYHGQMDMDYLVVGVTKVAARRPGGRHLNWFDRPMGDPGRFEEHPTGEAAAAAGIARAQADPDGLVERVRATWAR